MAVKITEICIACGSCIDECPVGAIVDDSQNPEGEDRYYVYANKCVACASACPTDGCIVWSEVVANQPSRSEISADLRDDNTPVFA